MKIIERSRRVDPAGCTSLFEKPQCSHRKDITMISRKYGIVVSSSLVTPLGKRNQGFTTNRTKEGDEPVPHIACIATQSLAQVSLRQE